MTAAQQRLILRTLIYIVLTLVTLVTIYPMIYMLATALRQTGTPSFLGIWPASFTLENMTQVFRETPLARMLFNSVLVTSFSTAATLWLGSLAAHAFSRRAFAGSRLFYAFLLLGIMLPFSTLMTPLFQIVKELKLRNNYLGLILPYTAANLPFCVLMMRNYFDSLPREIEEAAHVDGASNFQLYWRIAMPLSVPALTATGIFIAIGSWNEFILSLLFMTKPEMRTAPLATVYYLRYQGQILERAFAALTWVAIPALLFYFVAQRQFVKGLTAGALKG